VDRNYYYFLDKEGHIWHEGSEITDPRFALLVHRVMQKTPDGLLVKCQGENCFFEVEDVPYVIQSLALHKDHEGRLLKIDLIFPGGYVETLDPRTLYVSREDVLYCTVREGEFPARFSRKAYFQFIPFIQEGPISHSYFVDLANSQYPIFQETTRKLIS
jgi:hypothetical protein